MDNSNNIRRPILIQPIVGERLIGGVIPMNLDNVSRTGLQKG